MRTRCRRRSGQHTAVWAAGLRAPLAPLPVDSSWHRSVAASGHGQPAPLHALLALDATLPCAPPLVASLSPVASHAASCSVHVQAAYGHLSPAELVASLAALRSHDCCSLMRALVRRARSSSPSSWHITDRVQLIAGIKKTGFAGLLFVS